MSGDWFNPFVQVVSISTDPNPPVITIVSPTPGVAPGAVGGFPLDWQSARMTPIVFTVTDLTPGVRYICVVVRYNGSLVEETVYRRGQFRGNFAGTSAADPIANGLQFTVVPAGGWPSTDALNDVNFDVDAVDAAGNLG